MPRVYQTSTTAAICSTNPHHQSAESSARAPQTCAAPLPRAPVPHWLISHPTLSDRAVRLAALGAGHFADFSTRSFSRARQTIAKALQCSLRTADAKIEELVQAGAMKVTHEYEDSDRRWYKPSWYELFERPGGLFGPPAACVWAPDWLLLADVSDRAIRLYLVLAVLVEDGTPTVSLPTLADRLRCSVSSVKRARRELLNLRAITPDTQKDDAGDAAANVYTVHLQPALVGVGSPVALGGVGSQVAQYVPEEKQEQEQPPRATRAPRLPDQTETAKTKTAGAIHGLPSSRSVVQAWAWKEVKTYQADAVDEAAAVALVMELAGPEALKLFPGVSLTAVTECVARVVAVLWTAAHRVEEQPQRFPGVLWSPGAFPEGAALLAEYGRLWAEVHGTAYRPTSGDRSKAATLAGQYDHVDIERGIRAYLARDWDSDPDHTDPFALFAALAPGLVLQTRRAYAKSSGLSYAMTPEQADAKRAAEEEQRSLPSHLARVVTRLASVRATGRLSAPLDERLDNMARELDGARRRLADAPLEDVQSAVITRLAALDVEMVQAVRASLDEPSRTALMADVDGELASYRERMAPEAFARAREQCFDRRVRMHIGLPVLTHVT